MQQLAVLSRRNLLKTGLVGTVVVGLAGVGLAFRETTLRPDTPKLKVLDAQEYAVLYAFADRICPALGEGAPGASALGTAHAVDDLLVLSDVDMQRGVKLALRVFENAAFGALFAERLAPFTELSADARDRVLRAWRDSRVGFRRTVFRALSSTVLAVYWGDARTWPRTRYAGPPDLAALRATYAANLVPMDDLRAHANRQGS